ncbi:glycine decarboxylase subunit H KNAG_0D05050 [Huiozyma naganishii CBS 8797]|uniref:Glycine cleavage system H protein n=1 Tax=Huiozyma naganishii (strain ATCC MYA-139 / BCRC 22969 / CBS 8797 / KCTC 17520 / NBRC 10181 / NCYC 3082 / Yp74L-3) TaxID=1071383 RepID=J7S678_HUIN7|nr:hypothetical protein KNAG_0D05050 [Kazachstania naganishii CBS 8797]CCK70244.1 hypothetical protein KNAG_0D05050 [Kazachstania naganishii CBS 8797]
MLSTGRVLLRQSATIPRLFLRAQSTNSLNKLELPFKYSNSGPSQVKYTKDHEWVSLHEDGTAFLGITKYAADALGDATYVELPETGREVEVEESVGSVESVKSASEVYMPLAGTVKEVNTALEESPQLINEDPLGKGWMVQFEYELEKSKAAIDGLYTLEQYEKFLKE